MLILWPVYLLLCPAIIIVKSILNWVHDLLVLTGRILWFLILNLRHLGWVSEQLVFFFILTILLFIFFINLNVCVRIVKLFNTKHTLLVDSGAKGSILTRLNQVFKNATIRCVWFYQTIHYIL